MWICFTYYVLYLKLDQQTDTKTDSLDNVAANYVALSVIGGVWLDGTETDGDSDCRHFL